MKTGHVSTDGTRYLTCAETAKLVRQALKKAFPGTKFSVRSDTYANGASIRVRYTDGPASDKVDAVARGFAGSGFDGMIDLKFYKDHWLMPDGSVQIAKSGGGGTTYPEVIEDPPSPNAKLVSLGADYVFVERDLSDEFRTRIEEHIVKTFAGFENGYDPNEQIGGNGDKFWRIAQKTDVNGEIVDGVHRP
jgi:hypothetical protein